MKITVIEIERSGNARLTWLPVALAVKKYVYNADIAKAERRDYKMMKIKAGIPISSIL